MAPTLAPGARVLVDTCDTRPSPAGVIVLWDSVGLMVKRVQSHHFNRTKGRTTEEEKVAETAFYQVTEPIGRASCRTRPASMADVLASVDLTLRLLAGRPALPDGCRQGLRVAV